MSDAPTHPGRLLGALVNYGLGSYVPQIVNLLLVPLYSRYIPPADMGALELAFSVQAVLAVVMRLGLPGAVGRLYFDAQHSEARQKDLITTVAAAIAALSVGLGLLASLAGWWGWERLYPEVPFYPYVVIAIVSSALMSAPEIQRRVLQVREESRRSAALSAGLAIFTTVATFFFVVVSGLGALGVLLANLGGSLLFAVVAWVNHRDDLRGRFDRAILKEAAAYGLPLLPNHVAAWVHQNVARFVLAGVVSTAALGTLAMAIRVTSPFSVVTGAFSSAFNPIYFSWRLKLSPDAAFAETKKVGDAVLVLGAIGVMGAGSFGSLAIRFLVAKDYAPAIPLVGILASALFFHLIYTFLSSEIFFSKRTKGISLIFIMSAAINIVVLLGLVPIIGVLSSVVAQMVGGLLSCVMAARMNSVVTPLPLSLRSTVGAALGCAIGCVMPFGVQRLGSAAAVASEVGLFLVGALLVLLVSGWHQPLRAVVRRLLARLGGRPPPDVAKQVTTELR